jgi:MATE family multidrug resistance protein
MEHDHSSQAGKSEMDREGKGSAVSPSPFRRELRALTALATPVVAVQVGLMLMGIVDVMMLGRVSEVALASGALGNAVAMSLLIPAMGVLMALDPLVSQAFGARDDRQMSVLLERGAVIAFLLTVPVCIVMGGLATRLHWLGQPAELAVPAGRYLWALLPGNLAFLLFVVWRQTLQAISLVRPAVIAIAIANLANLFVNWLLVFGNLGFPRLEVVGSGIATSISRWLLFLLLLLFSWPVFAPYRRGGPLQWWRNGSLRLSGLRQLVVLGLPVGLMLGLEFYVFAAVALLMGNLGSTRLAAHQIAISLASLSFMVPMGIAAAAAVRVGNAVGRHDSPAARRSATVALVSGAGVMVFFGALFILAPGPLARLFTGELPVLELAMVLLPIAGLFQVADGTQVVASGVLRGIADVRVPALCAFAGYWLIGLPIGWWLAFHGNVGPSGLWWGLTVGLASVAALLVLRIRNRFLGEVRPVEQH